MIPPMEMMRTTVLLFVIVWVLVVGLLVPRTLLELDCFANITTTIVITIVTSIGLLDLARPQVPWISP